MCTHGGWFGQIYSIKLVAFTVPGLDRALVLRVLTNSKHNYEQ